MYITKQRIIELIAIKFPSDAEFERTLEAPKATVSNWKRGISTTFYRKLPEIARLLDTTTAYLLGETDYQHPHPVSIGHEPEQKVIEVPTIVADSLELLGRISLTPYQIEGKVRCQEINVDKKTLERMNLTPYQIKLYEKYVSMESLHGYPDLKAFGENVDNAARVLRDIDSVLASVSNYSVSCLLIDFYGFLVNAAWATKGLTRDE